MAPGERLVHRSAEIRLMRHLLLPAVLVLAAAAWRCTPGEPSPDPVRSGGSLVSSLQVRTGGGEVQLTLLITNTGEQPVELSFSSGQSYDFFVHRRAGGEAIWQWSADRMFTQALRDQTLLPDSTLTFEERWNPAAGTAGEFTARGVLLATGHRVEREAYFRLP